MRCEGQNFPYYPYFQNDEEYRNIHTVFGYRNIRTVFFSTDNHDRRQELVDSLAWEARNRMLYPFTGSYGVQRETEALVATLQNQITTPEADLANAQNPGAANLNLNLNLNLNPHQMPQIPNPNPPQVPQMHNFLGLSNVNVDVNDVVNQNPPQVP